MPTARSRKTNLSAAASALIAAAVLFAPAARGADAVRPKPRINGWLALYDLAGRKGTTVIRGGDQNAGFRRELRVPGGEISVPSTGPGSPISGDTCELRIHYLDKFMLEYVPELKGDPEYASEQFSIIYDDKGCKGTVGNLRWVSKDSPKEERHMRRLLTPALFDYLGLVFLKGTRAYLRIE